MHLRKTGVGGLVYNPRLSGVQVSINPILIAGSAAPSEFPPPAHSTSTWLQAPLTTLSLLRSSPPPVAPPHSSWRRRLSCPRNQPPPEAADGIGAATPSFL